MARAVIVIDRTGFGMTWVLERDGWVRYRKFTRATHQTCLAHLLRRVGELLADAERCQAKTRTPSAGSSGRAWRSATGATPARWTRSRPRRRPGG